MNQMKQRPVCHRAEDLVSYLYGEASATDARDFAEHMEQCELCRTEFASFRHVHESVVVWRNEALGSVSLRPASPMKDEVAPPYQFVPRREKRSARAALREFFVRSPLWLRGATAFATLLLLALALFTVLRMWTPAPQVATKNSDKEFTRADFEQAVNNAVESRINALKNTQNQPRDNVMNNSPVPTGAFRKTARSQAARGPRPRLTPQEREQLAADLRLIPGREEDLPFVFSDEPEQ
jgi:hypothetical protein